MVNALAGTYKSSAMVVMHNLRFLELDKNRNIEQHKALIFESENCKYDVILGADFLRKYGRVEGVGVSGRGQTAGTADGPLIGP